MSNYFVDTHAHIFNEYYDNIESIVKSAKENNVNFIINSGCDNASNMEVLERLKCENMFGTVGIHPESVLTYTNEDLKFVEDSLNLKKIVAIGEIGLDYHYDKSTKEKQIKLFEEQLKLAEKYQKPVVIHSREATEDTINVLKKYNVKGVIHSFSGSLETANVYIKMGFLLGINGVVTFKNCNLKDVLEKIDLENIILETDSPYLTPHPYRGKRNEPKYIIEIAKYLAQLKDISLDELSTITNNNIKRIYDIP